MKNKNKLWDFVREQEKRLIAEPFGVFNVNEKKHNFIIECNLLTNLENPFVNMEHKKCKVNKKLFKNWKKEQKIIKNRKNLIFLNTI
jgi:hypothetical protein